jgi:hypothetical protein
MRLGPPGEFIDRRVLRRVVRSASAEGELLSFIFEAGF